MNAKSDNSKYTIGAIVLIVMGIIFIAIGFSRASTFFGLYFDALSIGLVIVGFFWLIGGAAYGVKAYKAAQEKKQV